jgi:hypothetical protein
MFTRSVPLLLASLVALGGWLWLGAKPFAPEPTPPSPADEFTVSGPFTHGNLTVFLLHGPDAERSRPVLGLDEALARKCAIVHETGEVNELTVENTSEEDDLLLLSGDIVKGGRQDRVLQATMILPPKSGKVPVRSFCVEQSRWTKRGSEADTHFADNRAVIAGKELKKAVQLAGSQGEVWQNVAVQQAALSQNVGTVVNSKDSPTSLQLALENEKVQAEVAKFREAITAKVGDTGGAVGFVTVVNGQVTGAEAFASHAVFQKAWAKSVNAAAVEAVAEKAQRPFAEMTPDGVKAFLANAGREHEREEVTTSTQLASAYAPTMMGDGDPDFIRTFNVVDDHGRSNVRVVRDGLSSPRPLTFPTPHSEDTPAAPELNRLTLGRTVRNHGRDNYREAMLPATGAGIPAVEEKKSAVVEYREKGNGAVIHKSFLAK